MSTQAQTQELLDSVSPTCQNEPKPLLRQSQTAESPSKDDLSHTIVDETWPDSSQNDVGPQKLNAQEIQQSPQQTAKPVAPEVNSIPFISRPVEPSDLNSFRFAANKSATITAIGLGLARNVVHLGTAQKLHNQECKDSLTVKPDVPSSAVCSTPEQAMFEPVQVTMMVDKKQIGFQACPSSSNVTTVSKHFQKYVLSRAATDTSKTLGSLLDGEHVGPPKNELCHVETILGTSTTKYNTDPSEQRIKSVTAMGNAFRLPNTQRHSTLVASSSLTGQGLQPEMIFEPNLSVRPHASRRRHSKDSIKAPVVSFQPNIEVDPDARHQLKTPDHSGKTDGDKSARNKRQPVRTCPFPVHVERTLSRNATDESRQLLELTGRDDKMELERKNNSIPIPLLVESPVLSNTPPPAPGFAPSKNHDSSKKVETLSTSSPDITGMFKNEESRAQGRHIANNSRRRTSSGFNSHSSISRPVSACSNTSLVNVVSDMVQPATGIHTQNQKTRTTSAQNIIEVTGHAFVRDVTQFSTIVSSLPRSMSTRQLSPERLANEKVEGTQQNSEPRHHGQDKFVDNLPSIEADFCSPVGNIMYYDDVSPGAIQNQGKRSIKRPVRTQELQLPRPQSRSPLRNTRLGRVSKYSESTTSLQGHRLNEDGTGQKLLVELSRLLADHARLSEDNKRVAEEKEHKWQSEIMRKEAFIKAAQDISDQCQRELRVLHRTNTELTNKLAKITKMARDYKIHMIELARGQQLSQIGLERMSAELEDLKRFRNTEVDMLTKVNKAELAVLHCDKRSGHALHEAGEQLARYEADIVQLKTSKAELQISIESLELKLALEQTKSMTLEGQAVEAEAVSQNLLVAMLKDMPKKVAIEIGKEDGLLDNLLSAGELHRLKIDECASLMVTVKDWARELYPGISKILENYLNNNIKSAFDMHRSNTTTQLLDQLKTHFDQKMSELQVQQDLSVELTGLRESQAKLFQDKITQEESMQDLQQQLQQVKVELLHAQNIVVVKSAELDSIKAHSAEDSQLRSKIDSLECQITTMEAAEKIAAQELAMALRKFAALKKSTDEQAQTLAAAVEKVRLYEGNQAKYEKDCAKSSEFTKATAIYKLESRNAFLEQLRAADAQRLEKSKKELEQVRNEASKAADLAELYRSRSTKCQQYIEEAASQLQTLTREKPTGPSFDELLLRVDTAQREALDLKTMVQTLESQSAQRHNDIILSLQPHEAANISGITYGAENLELHKQNLKDTPAVFQRNDSVRRKDSAQIEPQRTALKDGSEQPTSGNSNKVSFARHTSTSQDKGVHKKSEVFSSQGTLIQSEDQTILTIKAQNSTPITPQQEAMLRRTSTVLPSILKHIDTNNQTRQLALGSSMGSPGSQSGQPLGTSGAVGRRLSHRQVVSKVTKQHGISSHVVSGDSPMSLKKGKKRQAEQVLQPDQPAKIRHTNGSQIRTTIPNSQETGSH